MQTAAATTVETRVSLELRIAEATRMRIPISGIDFQRMG